MDMQKLFISHNDCLEYEVCSFLMRKRILKAYIHFPNDEIMDRVSDYMLSCKIPTRYLNDPSILVVGYTLCLHNAAGKRDDMPHVYLLSEMNNELAEKDNILPLVIEGENDTHMTEEIIDLDEVPIHLQNSQIRKMFLNAFRIAETEIDIISPWMNRGVVNSEFLHLMGDALSRGVKIKILYGLNPDSNEYNLSRSRRSDQTADLMRTKFADKSDLLMIKRDNIHYKLVLCDEKYKLEGGFNYLSFIGNYNDSNTRREGSPFGRNIEEIRFLRSRYFED